jgi:hypothetical protein
MAWQQGAGRQRAGGAECRPTNARTRKKKTCVTTGAWLRNPRSQPFTMQVIAFFALFVAAASAAPDICAPLTAEAGALRLGLLERGDNPSPLYLTCHQPPLWPRSAPLRPRRLPQGGRVPVVRLVPPVAGRLSAVLCGWQQGRDAGVRRGLAGGLRRRCHQRHVQHHDWLLVVLLAHGARLLQELHERLAPAALCL